MLAGLLGCVVCWVCAWGKQARCDVIVQWCWMQLQAFGRIRCRPAAQGCSHCTSPHTGILVTFQTTSTDTVSNCPAWLLLLLLLCSLSPAGGQL
jgi:hypothetical protein